MCVGKEGDSISCLQSIGLRSIASLETSSPSSIAPDDVCSNPIKRYRLSSASRFFFFLFSDSFLTYYALDRLEGNERQLLKLLGNRVDSLSARYTVYAGP